MHIYIYIHTHTYHILVVMGQLRARGMPKTTCRTNV